MRTLKYIFLVTLGLAAWMWVQICFLVAMPETTDPLTGYSYAHALLLILSVAYLHWALREFLLPHRGLPKEQILELRQAVNTKYAKGFLSGTIGFGYLLLILHAAAYLDRSVSNRPGFLSGAIVLIALGTLAQARATIQYLCQVCIKESNRIDQ